MYAVVAERERLTHAKRASTFTFEADVSVHIPDERAAECVIAEAGLIPVAGLGEEHAAAGERPDLDTPRTNAPLLRRCADGSKQHHGQRG
jgi:hypothetical protein